VRFTVYPDAAHIANGLSTGYAGETQNELTNWISVQHPAVTLAPGASALDTITIKVPAGATITIEVPAGATQGEPRRPPLPSPPSPRAGQPAGSRPSSPTAGTRRHLHIEGVQLLRRAGEVRRMVLATFALAESTVIEVTGIARVSNGTRSRAAHF
jgi:hypothetical protein